MQHDTRPRPNRRPSRQQTGPKRQALSASDDHFAAQGDSRSDLAQINSYAKRHRARFRAYAEVRRSRTRYCSTLVSSRHPSLFTSNDDLASSRRHSLRDYPPKHASAYCSCARPRPAQPSAPELCGVAARPPRASMCAECRRERTANGGYCGSSPKLVLRQLKFQKRPLMPMIKINI
jgi:hypothetical protein